MIFNKILFLGPHTDDEMACSGTLCKFMEEGSQIFVAVFSFCEESVPPKFPKNILHTEFNEAMNILKINPDNIFKYNFKVRYFPRDRQEILEKLILLKNKIKPDLILLPALVDIHQDHHIIAKEGIRAFNKISSIFGYEIPCNMSNFNGTGFIEIKDKHLQTKIKSLNCYKSQKNKPYTKKEFVKSFVKMRGVQSGVKMAETFEIIKLKIK
jgi:LmbE family N-acetylglucosaminyl deacetylase